MSLLDNNVKTSQKGNTNFESVRALFVKPLHPCYNFTLILHENAIFFSQAEVRKFFTYIFIKLKASAVIAASFSEIIKKKNNKGLQSEGSLIQASCLTSQARLSHPQARHKHHNYKRARVQTHDDICSSQFVGFSNHLISVNLSSIVSKGCRLSVYSKSSGNETILCWLGKHL